MITEKNKKIDLLYEEITYKEKILVENKAMVALSARDEAQLFDF